MKNQIKEIGSWIREIKNDLLSKKIDAAHRKKKTRPATPKGMVNTYDDQHIYLHMNPADKRKPKTTARRPLKKKDVYTCFGWQLHPYDIQKLTEYIDNNVKLIRVKNRSIVEAAAEADILILTSGSAKYHVDSLLSDIDTAEKIIIIASLRDLESVRQDVTHRIDYHFNKLLPFSQSDFNTLIDTALEECTEK